ncbi:hypothetical protein B9Z55_028964 [Caenorhabditis nigoni]|uniref:Uncharacterized protein n=1 Tax=Caenorhabditis nigoni TaxID=1611254 RepID=A0A2G5S9C9_9PELO|nr:hypothetical protein B9Z55_028964 [Caenorhabditis nigoni]
MTSTSGIYNKSGRESIKKASVETYDNQQMPDELAAFHAFHLDSRVDSIEMNKRASRMELDTRRKSSISWRHRGGRSTEFT